MCGQHVYFFESGLIYKPERNKNMNKVIMIGRLTKDPEVRQAGEGKAANYSIAVERRFKREGQPEADFFNLVSFGKQAEFVEKYLKKGTKIAVVGQLQNDNYKNKDGQTVHSTQILVEEVEFAESKGSGNGGNDEPAAPAAPAAGGENVDDLLKSMGIS